MQDEMRLSVFSEKKDRQLVYKPEKCIGCGTCVQSCPKGNLSVGAVGAVTRGLLDADFLEMKEAEDCLVCGICGHMLSIAFAEFSANCIFRQRCRCRGDVY